MNVVEKICHESKYLQAVDQSNYYYSIFLWTVLLDLFELFDLEVKGQGPTKVITVRDTPPYGHAPTYQLSLTYLERQKSYGLDKLRWEEAKAEEKIRLKQYVSLRSKGRHNKFKNLIRTSKLKFSFWGLQTDLLRIQVHCPRYGNRRLYI